ncbi:hypothetical protein GCM10010912_49810 [Paenibacillus albidus]|uniref:Core-binding (CB) domain-containing protein n=1 Tax=Paenibacillus albidus TaxID=2041023 RepID=A0A917CTI3_9BACL|nr:hypothetical protein [Paenibacillus albidus]GGF99099.1 hypothetical protein GCM10010912_49810 [Paenibacillus albidus]
MILSELWLHYEADKRIEGFSPNTLNAYALQLRMLVTYLGNIDISEVTLNLLKEYLAKQSDRLKPSSQGPKWIKQIPKFLMEEDVIHLKISCQILRETGRVQSKEKITSPLSVN